MIGLCNGCANDKNKTRKVLFIIHLRVLVAENEGFLLRTYSAH